MNTSHKLEKRRHLRFYLIAMSVSTSICAPAMAKPDELSLSLNPATKESAAVSSSDDRKEVSLLLSLEDNETPSLDELTTVPRAIAASESESYASTQLLQQRFANGKVNVERYVTEDAEGNLINHGAYKEFDQSGAVIRSGSFTFGILDGAWSQTMSPELVQTLSPKLDPGFRPPFKSEATFVDGKLHGDWTVTDSKGSPVFLWQFDQGNRDNVSTWFDSRHAVILEIHYASGVPDGPSTQMVAGQREPKTVVFDHGRIVDTKTSWYEKGKKRAEETILVPAAKKLVSHDWWNSSVVSESLPPTEAIRQGSYTAWHANGQKAFEGNFESGAPHGTFQWWYPNGQSQTIGSYENGDCLGSWVWYHPNGMKKMQGTYDDGLQAGQWSSWNEEGLLTLRAVGSEFPLVKKELDFEQVEVAEASPSKTKSSSTVKVKHASRRSVPTKKR